MLLAHLHGYCNITTKLNLWYSIYGNTILTGVGSVDYNCILEKLEQFGEQQSLSANVYWMCDFLPTICFFTSAQTFVGFSRFSSMQNISLLGPISCCSNSFFFSVRLIHRSIILSFPLTFFGLEITSPNPFEPALSNSWTSSLSLVVSFVFSLTSSRSSH